MTTNPLTPDDSRRITGHQPDEDLGGYQRQVPATDPTGTQTGGVNQLLESVATVKQLIAAGLLDPAALGLPTQTVPTQTVPTQTVPTQTVPTQTVPTEAIAAATTPEDTTAALPHWFLVPGEAITVRALVAKTKRGLKPSTRRAYGCYLDLLADGYQDDELNYPGLGDKLAHEVLTGDLETALGVVKARALRTAARRAEVRESVDRESRHSTGEGARYNAIGAWRRAFQVAVQDRHLARQFNPAQDLKKPARLTGTRRPLKTPQMRDFWAVVQNTGNDPELDLMICKTILISGARREGLMNLDLGDIDREECTLRLDEKFDKVRYQPVPDWFAIELREFATARGAARRGDQVFRLLAAGRQLSGTPITSRRLDNLFQRVQATLPWADKAQLTAHTLRHHAIALVERLAGGQVSTVFAGHEPEDTNSLYGRASREEVAQAVIDLHGGNHPWLSTDREV